MTESESNPLKKRSDKMNGSGCSDKRLPSFEKVTATLLPLGTRADLYQQIAGLYIPPTWEIVGGAFDRLLSKYSGFLVSGNPQVKIARELDLLEKEAYLFSIETFQEEYLRLFVNAPEGVAVPPYASFYTEGRLYGKAARDAQIFYERFQLSPASKGAEPPDYIVYELEFLSFLCSMQQKALEGERAEEVRELDRAQVDFFVRHFFPWANRFCDRLFEASRLAYFQILGIFTKGFLLNERRLLGKKDSSSA